MSSPNRTDRGRLAPPPSNPRTSVRNAQNATQTTIMIEPTPEYQHFYNQNRREMDKQRLELHVTESNLELPQAEPMSRSTTSDSHPSPSTVCSYTGDSITPLSPDLTTETIKSRPSRGRRRGPLDMETRTKTAFKRKFKLTCAFHRAKRTTCNCHDFSKLEEGYRSYLAAEGQKTKTSRSQSVRSLGDIGTFGTGGAGGTGGTVLTTPHYQSLDLPIGHEFLPHVNEHLLPVLELDIDSAVSVNAIVSAPREEPFFLAVATPTPIPIQDATSSMIAIGCSTTFRNRWQCEYRYSTEEAGSRDSSDSCSWTGPLEQLETHFRTEHHPFEPAAEPHWSLCEVCDEMSPGWVQGEMCLGRGNCHLARWKKWFFGDAPRQPNPDPPILTVSEASGSRSSWINPSWNMITPGSSNTEQSNLPYSSSTSKSGFYEHSVSGNANNEAGSSEEKNDAYRGRGRTQSRYQYQPNTANFTRRCIGCCSLLPTRNMNAKSASYEPRLTLSPSSRLCRHLIPLLALLIVFHLRTEQSLIKSRSNLLAFLASIHCLRWYLALITFGPLCAWIAMGSLQWQGWSLYLNAIA